MQLSRSERMLMNNPMRVLLQRWYEAPIFERLGGRVDGLCVLEVGCGRGVGVDILLKRFGAREVHAFDIDPALIEQARRRLAGYPPDRVRLSVGDVTAIRAQDAAFDAVFDFGILHHVPEWQAAVSEIRRVLRPGGRFFFEEVTRRALDSWPAQNLFDHPTENRFSSEEFVAELERQGFSVGTNVVSRFFGNLVFGVGRWAGKERAVSKPA